MESSFVVSITDRNNLIQKNRLIITILTYDKYWPLGLDEYFN